MEEEFIATIKLVSGEEIVARVAYMPEEESCLIHEPMEVEAVSKTKKNHTCLLYTSPSPRDATLSRMPSSA